MSSSFYSPLWDPVIPELVTQWEASRTTRHIVHEVIGSSVPDVTLQFAGPRTGTMSALFDNEDAAFVLTRMLGGRDVIEFSDDTSSSAGMTFVANGTFTMTTDSQDHTRWTVTFPYLEVQQ